MDDYYEPDLALGYEPHLCPECGAEMYKTYDWYYSYECECGYKE